MYLGGCEVDVDPNKNPDLVLLDIILGFTELQWGLSGGALQSAILVFNL